MAQRRRGASCAPDGNLGRRTFAAQKTRERLECVCHVTVTQVPGRTCAAVHCVVVLLGIKQQPCILLGVDEIIVCGSAILDDRFARLAVQFDKLRNQLVFATVAHVEIGCEAISLNIITVDVEAGVPLAYQLGRFRVDLV